MIVSADGIELRNGANIKISGSRVTTISELNTKIAQATQNLRYAISNHVFGTSSIADNSITTDKIASDAVTSDKIVSNAVTTVKIEDNAITSSKLANNAVITDKIANGAITESKISTGAVTSSKINDGAVNSYKIAASSITTEKITDGAVNADKLSANSVSANKITTGAISADKIADNAVSSAKIAENAVTTVKIADYSVTSGKIDNDAVTSDKIAIGTITSNKIASNAVTSDKIADSSITGIKLAEDSISSNKIITSSIYKKHLSTNLTSDLIFSGGGTVTGCLEVAHMKFNAEADWLIGQTNICSDIVLLNEDARIRSNAGQLKLSASQGESISAESFLSFDSGSQAGIVMITNGLKEVDIQCENITSEAIIMLTPRQIVTNLWWSVQPVPSDSKIKITIDKEWPIDLFFNYFIIRK